MFMNVKFGRKMQLSSRKIWWNEKIVVTGWKINRTTLLWKLEINLNGHQTVLCGVHLFSQCHSLCCRSYFWRRAFVLTSFAPAVLVVAHVLYLTKNTPFKKCCVLEESFKGQSSVSETSCYLDSLCLLWHLSAQTNSFSPRWCFQINWDVSV